MKQALATNLAEIWFYAALQQALCCAAAIRTWSKLPQDVQNHLFQEAVTSQCESIRSQLAVFLHDKHSRTADPLGKPREMPEPDSLEG